VTPEEQEALDEIVDTIFLRMYYAGLTVEQMKMILHMMLAKIDEEKRKE